MHQTPKSLRRTPNLAFKITDTNLATAAAKEVVVVAACSSPEMDPTHQDTMMEVDFYQSTKKHSATKSRLTKQQQQQHLRMRLFDQNEGVSTKSALVLSTSSANKILNFDDTDNEDEYLKVTGLNAKSSSSDSTAADDEMRSLFEPHKKPSASVLGPPQTPLLSNSSQSRSVPPPSSSSASLFRPIQRCKLTCNILYWPFRQN